MKNLTLKYQILLITFVSLIIGYYISFGNIFHLLFAIIILGLFIVISIIIIAINYHKKNLANKYFILIFFLSISSLTFGVTGFTIILATKKNDASKMVESIEIHKRNHGVYPNSLDTALTKQLLPQFNYWTDSSRTKFSISYDYNGWQVASYENDKKEWVWSD